MLTTAHYATADAFRLGTLRDRITVRQVSLYDEPENASHAEIVERLVQAITRKTRLALT